MTLQNGSFCLLLIILTQLFACIGINIPLNKNEKKLTRIINLSDSKINRLTSSLTRWPPDPETNEKIRKINRLKYDEIWMDLSRFERADGLDKKPEKNPSPNTLLLDYYNEEIEKIKKKMRLII